MPLMSFQRRQAWTNSLSRISEDAGCIMTRVDPPLSPGQPTGPVALSLDSDAIECQTFQSFRATG